MQRVEVTLREFAETFGAKKPRYSEIRDFIESRRPEWVRALVPRIIEAPAVYWPQKVLAVAAIEALFAINWQPMEAVELIARLVRSRPTWDIY